MTTPPMDQIVASFRERVCRQIDLKPEGVERYVVSNPFVHDDGDCLEIVLRRDGDQWALVDEGCTFMRLTYDIDEVALHRGTRQKIIANTLGMFGVEDRGRTAGAAGAGRSLRRRPLHLRPGDSQD